jgi:hypothetical protein
MLYNCTGSGKQRRHNHRSWGGHIPPPLGENNIFAGVSSEKYYFYPFLTPPLFKTECRRWWKIQHVGRQTEVFRPKSQLGDQLTRFLCFRGSMESIAMLQHDNMTPPIYCYRSRLIACHEIKFLKPCQLLFVVLCCHGIGAVTAVNVRGFSFTFKHADVHHKLHPIRKNSKCSGQRLFPSRFPNEKANIKLYTAVLLFYDQSSIISEACK